MGVPAHYHEWPNGYDLMRTGRGLEFRLIASGVRWFAIFSAVVVGGLVAVGVGGIVAAIWLVLQVTAVALGADATLVPLAAFAALLPGAWLVFAAARATRRRALRDSNRVLTVHADGLITFGDAALVSPGTARVVWVETVEQTDSDSGESYQVYMVSVDRPGGPVWLPVPMRFGVWLTDGGASRAPTFASRSTAYRLASEVGTALGVPVLDRTA
jgi:hypothetical protein